MVRVIVFVVVSVCALFLHGCGMRERQTRVSAPPPTPAVVHTDFDQILPAFGQIATSYCVNNDEPIIVDIDIIPNTSPDKLPIDLGGYCRRAIDAMGRPFGTTRSVADGLTIFKGAGPVLMEREKPKGPNTRYKIVGNLEGASPVWEMDSNGQIVGAGGKARWQLDTQLGRQKHLTKTNVTVTFTLEDSNGLSFATARYRIVSERLERDWSLGVYLAASGFSKDIRITQTDDLTDALYSVTSAAMVHLLSHGQCLIPAYRLSPIFKGDENNLIEHLRDSLSRSTREEVEAFVKRLVYVNQQQNQEQMDLTTASVTDSDRAKIVAAMVPLNYSDSASLISFATRLWGGLDWVNGSQKVRDRLADVARLKAERKRAEELAAAALLQGGKSPREFGWPESATVVVLDLSQVEVKARENILAIARRCSGLQEMKSLDADNTIVGIRLLGSPAPEPNEVQHALRLSSLPLQFVWTIPDHRLVVAHRAELREASSSK